MTETSKENEMSEERVEALGKIIRDAGISGVTSDRIGPFDRARADAVIAAGWVSPEEHAEYVAMEGRFSELLCDLTDGLLSKTNYDVRAMVQQVEQTFEKYAAEDVAAARSEAKAAVIARVEAAVDGVWYDADSLYDAVQAALIIPEEPS